MAMIQGVYLVVFLIAATSAAMAEGNGLALRDGTYLPQHVSCKPGWSTDDFYRIRGKRVDRYEEYCTIKKIFLDGQLATIAQSCLVEGEEGPQQAMWQILSTNSFATNSKTYTRCRHNGGP